jgi:hypothetical protein
VCAHRIKSSLPLSHRKRRWKNRLLCRERRKKKRFHAALHRFPKASRMYCTRHDTKGSRGDENPPPCPHPFAYGRLFVALVVAVVFGDGGGGSFGSRIAAAPPPDGYRCVRVCVNILCGTRDALRARVIVLVVIAPHYHHHLLLLLLLAPTLPPPPGGETHRRMRGKRSLDGGLLFGCSPFCY